MKLLRYGNPGEEKPGCLDAQEQIRDLSHIVSDITGHVLATQLDSLQKLDVTTLPIVKNNPRLGPCIHEVGKFLCIGLNYADHALETGAEIPTEPVIFLKANSCINGPYDPIIIPHGSTHTDWEVELGIIIKKPAKRIKIENVQDYIAGYCIVNDVSERHYQKLNTSQWAKGKSCDTFGPVGPWLVTTDEIVDPQNLSLWLEVDGKRYQEGHSSNMIFNVKQIIAYVSQFLTLYPGDIISTGTPAGVGFAQKPNPIYLRSGQTMRLGISGLGEQQHSTIAEKIS